jgi:hypothetical protein
METQDAVRNVIGAFQSANLVALGERHWAREDSELRLRLIQEAAILSFRRALDNQSQGTQ